MARRVVRGLLLVSFVGYTGCSTSTSPSSGTDTGGSTTSCRTYGTVQLVNTFPASIVTSGFSSLSGKYDPSTRQATFILAASFNGPICATSVFTYGSTVDFVDEVSVIPPKTLQSSMAINLAASCGNSTSNQVYAYDSQRRLTRVLLSNGDSISYNAWDGFGRPTLGTFSTGGTISNVYDNAARTTTITQSRAGVSTTTVNTYDANGILINTVDGGTGQTSTYTVTATETICK